MHLALKLITRPAANDRVAAANASRTVGYYTSYWPLDARGMRKCLVWTETIRFTGYCQRNISFLLAAELHAGNFRDDSCEQSGDGIHHHVVGMFLAVHYLVCDDHIEARLPCASFTRADVIEDVHCIRLPACCLQQNPLLLPATFRVGIVRHVLCEQPLV